MGFAYDTWGGSFGTAWSNSWGENGGTPPVTPPPPVPVVDPYYDVQLGQRGEHKKRKRLNPLLLLMS